LLALIIMSAFLCGCTGLNNTRPEDIRAEAMAYLDKNYSDKFTARTYTSDNWAYDYESVTFKSEKFPDSVVGVRIYKDDDGTYSFQDNYYHCYMLDSAVNYGKSLISQENAVVKVRFQNTVWSDELEGARTFDEWKEHGTARADFFIITGNALSDDLQAEIVNKMAEDKVFGSVWFFVTNDKELLKDKPLDEILNNQREFIVSESKYRINSKFEIETNP